MIFSRDCKLRLDFFANGLYAALLYEDVNFISQNNQTDNETDEDGCYFQVGRAVDGGYIGNGGAAHHGAIVHSHEKTDGLRKVANIGTVIVICLSVGEID